MEKNRRKERLPYGSASVVIVKEGKALVIATNAKATRFQLIGGRRKKGEKLPRETVLREGKEEIGILLDNRRLQPLKKKLQYYKKNGKKLEHCSFVYYVEEDEIFEPKNEKRALRWIPLEKLLEGDLFSWRAYRFFIHEVFATIEADNLNVFNDQKRVQFMAKCTIKKLEEGGIASGINPFQRGNLLQKMNLLLCQIKNQLVFNLGLQYEKEIAVVIGAAAYGIKSKAADIVQRWERNGTAQDWQLEKVNEFKLDLTEWLASAQRLLLRNIKNKAYVRVLFEAFQYIWSWTGLNEGLQETFIRGLLGEVAAYRLLERHFAKVEASTPEEDVMNKIDFIAETKEGKKYIFLVKSSRIFPESLLASYEDFKDNAFLENLQNSSPLNDKDYFFERLNKLLNDLAIAKEFADARGFEGVYVLNVDPDDVAENGEPRWRKNSIRKLMQKISSCVARG